MIHKKKKKKKDHYVPRVVIKVVFRENLMTPTLGPWLAPIQTSTVRTRWGS